MQTERQWQKRAMQATALILAAMGLLCGLRGAKAQGDVPPFAGQGDNRVQSILLPTDRAGMTDQLITHTKDSTLANIALSKARPEETFAIVRDNWKNVTDTESRQKLLFAMVHSDNPHLLEVLDIGVNDTEALVRAMAYDLLQNFAYQYFGFDPAAYKTWHAGIVGKPVAEVVATGCAAFVAQYLKADARERFLLLSILNCLEFKNTIESNDTSELAKVRRRAALDAGLLTGIEQTLMAPGLTNDDVSLYIVVSSLRLASVLHVDEAFVQRAILPLTAGNVPPAIRRHAAGYLGSVSGTWATDRLFTMLLEDYRVSPSRDRWNYMAGLSNHTDPHLIPKLIAVLEADDSPQTAQLLGVALPRLTGVKFDGLHDGNWWHLWWDHNKTNFPADVQSIPYPKVILGKPIARPILSPVDNPVESKVFSIRRQMELHLVKSDAQREYCLLCPAYIAPTPVQTEAVTSAHKPTFGLIVALADSSFSEKELIEFWQEAIRKSLKDGYFVALPIAPKWSAHQPAAWITQQNMGQVKEARFSTETFLQEIVKDVEERYPINPNRLFLHGVGDGGLAAYACSLSDTTPFTGFYLLSSPFKTAQLPPLTHAKGHRYLIQQSKEDKVTPFFQAAAADELLRKQAAVVKLVFTKGEHGYKFADSPWEQVAQAIAWLETPH